MADVFRILGQSLPAAGTLTDAYTVPALTGTVISTLTVCNQSTLGATFRVALAIAGATDTPSQYIVYGATLAANETKVFTLGLSMSSTDVLRVYSSIGSISFGIFGVEVK